MDSFDSLLDQVVRSRASKASVVELLKYIRVNKLRHSQVVWRYGKPLLEKQGGSLKDEKWTIMEQVFLAALDMVEWDYADGLLAKLLRQFPDSSRVTRLVGMKNEVQKQFEAATETYDELIEANAANSLARKRKICILKAQGKIQTAVKELNEYIHEFESDFSAWQELAEIYLSVGKYDAAAFCFEELVLTNPMNHLYFCRLGEIYCTMGGEYLLDARKYFSKAAELKRDNNARALHGLATCCVAVATGSRKHAGNESVNQALFLYAEEGLTKLYKNAPSHLTDAAMKVLQDQHSLVIPEPEL